MEYQKLINSLGNTPNQVSKFRSKNWLKKMMTHLKCITPIVKSNLKI